MLDAAGAQIDAAATDACAAERIAGALRANVERAATEILGRFGRALGPRLLAELEHVHRFSPRLGSPASLRLRHGDLRALDAYETHGRRCDARRFDLHCSSAVTSTRDIAPPSGCWLFVGVPGNRAKRRDGSLDLIEQRFAADKADEIGEERADGRGVSCWCACRDVWCHDDVR